MRHYAGKIERKLICSSQLHRFWTWNVGSLLELCETREENWFNGCIKAFVEPIRSEHGFHTIYWSQMNGKIIRQKNAPVNETTLSFNRINSHRKLVHNPSWKIESIPSDPIRLSKWTSSSIKLQQFITTSVHSQNNIININLNSFRSGRVRLDVAIMFESINSRKKKHLLNWTKSFKSLIARIRIYCKTEPLLFPQRSKFIYDRFVKLALNLFRLN